jgi:hypothetical protein
LTRVRAAALLLAVACALGAGAVPCVAGTPYDLHSGRDLERRVRGPAEPLPDVERAPANAALEAPAASDAAASVELAQALAQLEAAEWIDRLTGLYALQRMGSAAAPAAPRIAPLLADENGSVRMESAECLFRIGSPAVPLLVDALSSSSNDDARALAARTLGRIGLGARDAVPTLQGLRDDPSPEVAAEVAFALPMIAPHGPREWLAKIGFEIVDEPWGIPILIGAFMILVLGKVLWNAWRTERETAVPGGAEAMWRASSSRPAEEPSPAANEDDTGDAAPAPDDDEDEDGQDERITAERRGDEDHDPLQPTQGLPHAGAGLMAMAVAALVAFLGTTKEIPDERHGVWHFAALFFLFGWLFFRIGLAGEREARRARRRREANSERWLKDRAWDREGAGPVRAERVGPNLLPLALWIGFLLPFHTVWALPWSYWGVWIVLGIFDALAVAMIVGVLRNAWRALRSGRCRLRWEGAPVRPGATFNARFETSRAIGSDGKLEATLRCLRDRAENRVIGEEPAADAEEVWAEKRSFRVHDRPEGGSWAQLSFLVPAKARGTDSYAARPVRWVVVVTVEGAGPDLRATFPVPIYR